MIVMNVEIDEVVRVSDIGYVNTVALEAFTVEPYGPASHAAEQIYDERVFAPLRASSRL